MKNETPIFDDLNRQSKLFAASGDVLIDRETTTEQSLGTQALGELKVRLPMSKKGYSPGAQAVIEEINNAILDGKRTVGNGQSFINFAEGHSPYVTAHELTTLLGDVRRSS